MDAQRPGTLPAPRPDKVTRELLPSGLRLTYRWFGGKFIALAFFCLFWDGFIVFWYAGATAGMDFSRGFAGVDRFHLVFLLFPLIHVGVGIGMTYYVLCGFVNRTVIDVSGRELRIQSGPLPWRGNSTTLPSQIAQLYREEIAHHGKNGTTYTYQLAAALKDGKKLKLVSGLHEADQALFLEQEIERHLGIRDQPVAGEMRK